MPPSPTITGLRVRGLDLTLQRPVETASGTMRSTPLVLVDLTTSDGIIGRSYVRCYTPLALKPLVQLLATLEEVLRGEAADPFDIDRKLQRQFRLVGPQGLTGIAMAGIDMALWDARAKACDLPLVSLLGGAPRSIRAYATLRSMDPRAAAPEAEAAAAEGFTAIKVKLGRGELAADLEVVRALRSAVGDRVELMVDYNQSLSVTEAIARSRALDSLGLSWIEEPTRADDFEGHSRIAAEARTPIQLGENLWGVHDLAKCLAAQASDHITLDAMKLGGVTGWLRGAALAEASGRLASSHAFPEVSAHLLGVTPTAHWLEFLDHAGPILQEPLRARGGQVQIPERPGNGLAWNEELVERLRVD